MLGHVRSFATPWTVASQALCPWYSPGKNIGVGCHFPLERIFPTQGSNPCLLHCRQILYHLSHQGSPNTSLAKPPKLFLTNLVPPDTEANVTKRKFKQREMVTGNKDWQTYSTKGHRVNVLGFKDHKILSQLFSCHYSGEHPYITGKGMNMVVFY